MCRQVFFASLNGPSTSQHRAPSTFNPHIGKLFRFRERHCQALTPKTWKAASMLKGRKTQKPHTEKPWDKISTSDTCFLCLNVKIGFFFPTELLTQACIFPYTYGRWHLCSELPLLKTPRFSCEDWEGKSQRAWLEPAKGIKREFRRRQKTKSPKTLQEACSGHAEVRAGKVGFQLSR